MNGKDVILNGLAKCPVFTDIPEEKILDIARNVQNKIVTANTIIFSQGDPGDNFYVVNSGKVRVFRKSPDGLETNLAQLGPGDSFGEMSLLTGEPRMGFVESLEETDLTVIPKYQFDQILKNNPHVSSTMVKQVSSWLAQSNWKLESETERKSKAPGVSWVDFLIILGLGLLIGIVFNTSNPNGIRLIPNILSSEQIQTTTPVLIIEEYRKGKILLIDARPSNFFEQQHIEGTVNMPLALFDIIYMLELSDIKKDKEIIVYGRTISSLYDEQLARKLIVRGHKNTKILAGGLSDWKRSGYPIEP